MQNFTVADLSATTLAAVVYGVFLLPPGYLLGWASNVFNFRRSGAAERLLLSLTLSMAATPITAVLLGHAVPPRVVLIVFVVMAIASAALLVREVHEKWPLRLTIERTNLAALGLGLAWFLVVALSLCDLQIGNKLYVSYVAFDHAVRQALVGAAARSIPPHNPFFGMGEPPILRYFYYWYAVCALPMRVAGVSARAGFNASAFWCGLGLASLVPLYLKHFLHESRLRLKSLVGIALLAVTGLDLIPTVVDEFKTRYFVGDTEWWDPNQVTSWVGSLLWTPHHVAGLVAGLAGFLILAAMGEKTTIRERLIAASLAGAAFASAAGLSVFVTLVFAIFLVAWSAVLLFQKRFAEFACYITSAAVALVLSIPFLREMQSASTVGASGTEGGSKVVQFAFRSYPYFVEWLEANGIHNATVLNLAKVPALLFVYLLEFGFFAVVACIRFRELRSRGKLTQRERAAWLMFATALVAVTFLASTATDANDLGIRGSMVVQFILLLWAAPIVVDIFITRDLDIGPTLHGFLTVTLLIGVLSSAYQLVSLRIYAPLVDHGVVRRLDIWMGDRNDFATLDYEIRAGFEELEKKIPRDAVVQYTPIGIEGRVMRLYSRHQMVASDAHCGAAFGGDEATCKKMVPYLAMLFEAPQRMANWDLDQFCEFANIDVLVTTNVDPAWRMGNSWVYQRQPIVANHGFKAIACGRRIGIKK